MSDARRNRAAMALQDAWWGMDRVLNEDRLAPERSQAMQRGQVLVQASAARLQDGGARR